MQLKEFSQLLKSEFSKKVYFLVGNETVLVSKLIRAAKKKVIGDEPDEFSFVQFYGSTAQAGTILSEAEQIPFLSSKRLIVVKEADQLSTDDLNALAEYSQNPSDTTVLILIAQSVDKRTKFYKSITKTAEVIELNTPALEELRNWADKRIRKEGKVILPDALELLMAGSASTLTFLAQEVEKLLLLCREEPQITIDHVVQITSKSKMKSVFDMWEAIAVRKKDLAFYILRTLQQQRMTIQELIGLFRWQLARLFQGQELVSAGRGSKKEISSALKIPFFVADKFLSQLRQFPNKRIYHAYNEILRADEDLKVGSRREKEIIDLLIYKLMAS